MKTSVIKNLPTRGLAAALLVLGLTACAGMTEREKHMAVGAGVGAVAGSVLTGGSTVGTVAGGAIGGAIGAEGSKKK